jgi:hypothetical protein
VLVIEENREMIRGYELREGRNVRSLNQAPIKTYNRSRIAKGRQLRVDSQTRKEAPDKSTLMRKNLLNLIAEGA